MELKELLQEFIDHKRLRFEGDTGVENLNKVAKAIGYKEHGFAYGSPLEVFLSDNPGACDAIIEWMGEQNVEEWEYSLESELSMPEREDEDEDDESGPLDELDSPLIRI